MLTLQIKRWGNSAALRIPNSVLQQLGWKEGDALQAEVADKKLSISKESSTVEVDSEFYKALSEAGLNVSDVVNQLLAAEVKRMTSPASAEAEPKYTLEELLKGVGPNGFELTEEGLAWLNMKPKGKEL